MSDELKEFAVTIRGVRTYQVHVTSLTKEGAKAQVSHMIVSGSVDFSHDLIGFKWEIESVEEI